MDRRAFLKVASAAAVTPTLPDFPVEQDQQKANLVKPKLVKQKGFYAYSVMGYAVIDKRALDIITQARFE